MVSLTIYTDVACGVETMAYAKILVAALAIILKNLFLSFASLCVLLRLCVSNRRIAKYHEAPCSCAMLRDCRE